MGDQKSVGSNQRSNSPLRDSYSELFDERPDNGEIDGALYEKPSLFSRVGKWFNDVGVQFKTFFNGLGEGIQSAWVAVKRAFGSEDQAQQAVRHIQRPMTAQASVTFQVRESTISTTMPAATSSIDDGERGSIPATTDRATATDVANSAISSQTVQTAIDVSTTTESESPDIPLQTSQSQVATGPVDYSTQTPLELSDEDAFALFVHEFKQARREGREFSGAGRQQFEDAAKKHARKLLDAELASLDALGERQGDYALGTDQALAIEVASSLLNKPLPHQKLLNQTGQTSVPSYSQQDMECFDAWIEWRDTKILPGGKAIDLDGAVRYANEFIAKNVSDSVGAKRPDISRRLEQAYDLIRNKQTDEGEMSGQAIVILAEEVRADFSPVPLPPFPRRVTTIELQPINGGLQGFVIKKMITASRDYFSAIREAGEPDEVDKAQAIMFATLWQTGKSDSKTLQKMKAWNFFEPLDQLLDVEKIKNDFR